MTHIEAMKLALEALEKLWDIIDDIDTYGDMAKSDDKLYRSLVERRQRQRFEQTGISTDGYELNGGAITSLRQTIADFEKQEHGNPEDLYVEMHKHLNCPYCCGSGHIEDVKQEHSEPWLLKSTQEVAKAMAEKFYPEVTQWKVLDDLAGVISQIDNMTTGLIRKPKQEQGEPVAVIEVKGGKAWLHAELFTHLGDGLHKFYTTPQPKAEQGEPVAYIHRNEYNEYRLEPHDNFDIKSIPFNVDVPLCTTSQRKPLTDKEIWDLHIKMSAALNCKLSDLIELTRAVEAAHNIKEQS